MAEALPFQLSFQGPGPLDARELVNVTEGQLTSAIQASATAYAGQLLRLEGDGRAYVVTGPDTGAWRRFDGPRVIGSNESGLQTWILNAEHVYPGEHLVNDTTGESYVVLDPATGVWRRASGIRTFSSGSESYIDNRISGDLDSVYDGEIMWWEDGQTAVLVIDADTGAWRRLDGRLIIRGTAESGLQADLTTAPGIGNGQVVWLEQETAAYLVTNAATGAWRRLNGLTIVDVTEANLSAEIQSLQSGNRVWNAQTQALYVRDGTSPYGWHRIAEPPASRTVQINTDHTVTRYDDGRTFVVDTFLSENSGYGTPRTLTLPTDAPTGWHIDVQVDGYMALRIDDSNITLEGESPGFHIHQEGRTVRITCTAPATYRVEGTEHGLKYLEQQFLQNNRGYQLEQPQPQPAAVYTQNRKYRGIWYTVHGDTAPAGLIDVRDPNGNNRYSIATPFGMPVTLTYVPAAELLVTYDADARDFVTLDPTVYPGSDPTATATRTGTISSVAAGDDLFCLTADWVDATTVVYLFEVPDTTNPQLLEVRVDVTAPSITSETLETSVGFDGDTFYRIPRRHAFDRIRNRVWLIADAAAYAVEPGDWLTPVATVQLDTLNNDPDFWNAVHVRTKDLIYVLESGRRPTDVQSNLSGEGVAGRIAVIDPTTMQFVEHIDRALIQGGDVIAQVPTRNWIIGSPYPGTLELYGYDPGCIEVYNPTSGQALYRFADAENPGAVVNIPDQKSLYFVGDDRLKVYKY